MRAGGRKGTGRGFRPPGGRGAGGADLEELVSAQVRAELEDPDAGDVHRQLVERIERPMLETVLAHTEGNQIRAAAILGINRNTLRKKIVELGIELPTRGLRA